MKRRERVRIGFLGAGHIGGTLARLFTQAGHNVAVSNSRGPLTLTDLVADLGERGGAATTEEAVSFGEVLVVAVPFGRYRKLPAGGVAGKVVIDTNNYYSGRDGNFEELDDGRTTSSELLQEHLAGARLVKAFNSIQWQRLLDDGRPEGDPSRIGIPVSGDDEEAKRTVAGLIDQIGFDAVDAGALGEGGRKHQPGATAYGANLRTSELRELLA